MTRWNGINRTAMLLVRVSPEEKRQLQLAAKRAGLPVGTWVRDLCLKRALKGRKP